jgi:LuxR family maltose regulon positive regulatory protein
VRVWLKQGRQAEAQGWVHEQGLSVEDDIPYLREFEYITLARVLIAAAKNDRATDCLNQAAHLLSRLLKAAENGGRLGSVIPIQLLRALAFQAQYNLHEAHSSLKHALVLAEPEGYIRTFVDEGQALQLLIQKQATNLDQPLRSYADKLLAAFQQPEAAPNPSPLHPRPNLIEPLSERELEVLKLLRSELNGPEIAQQLIVSLNTFRTHTKSIFNKLGVNNRRAAIRRASELGLL